MSEAGSNKESEPEDRLRLISAEDAAVLLGVRKTWVLAEARADRIPHVRLGRYVRFEAPELELWWRARRRGPRYGRGHAT
jgi:excisionase family DNA binding protein